MTPKYWARACRELSRRDPTLRQIIQSYRGESLRSRSNAFETLLRSIVGQQISVKAADSVWRKVVAVLGETSPQAVLEARPADLRAAGLSERKVLYVRDLAEKFSQSLIRPHQWHSLSDDAIIEQLVQVKGVGRWTAEMFLIFHLLRPDVFPKDDLGLHKAISRAYGKRYPLGPRQLESFRQKFSPWSSVATWYLWRSLDPIPVEY